MPVLASQITMPFIGEDWRGPGEDWVKSEDGWEIRKVNAMDRGEEKKKDGVKRRRTKTEGDRPEDRKNAVVRFVSKYLSELSCHFILNVSVKH